MTEQEKELQKKELLQQLEEERSAGASESDPDTMDQMEQKRLERIQGFCLDIDFKQEYSAEQPQEDPIAETEAEGQTIVIPAGGRMPGSSARKTAPRQKRRRTSHWLAWSYVRMLFYLIIILALSGIFSVIILVGAIDLTGLNRSKIEVEITIPPGATAAQVAEILHQNGIIEQPLLFRLYVGLTNSGASLQSGTFTVASAYGYAGIIEMLQQSTARETVRITIPEGYTVQKIAALLEKNKVCSAVDFYNAVNSRDYDYSFVAEIPSAQDNAKYSNRIYLLEGYLFPDTYEFFIDSDAKTVVDRMLQNFNNKVTSKMRAAIRQKGYTLDEAIRLSSIIQSEVGLKEDMLKVARVLLNRLENPAVYPKLQCNTTTYYIKGQTYYEGGVPIVVDAYDTYTCIGLPVGAISNPGLLAIESFITPSSNSAIKSCYFFATDTTTGITYYSRTLAEHNAICKKYNIAEKL